MSNIDGVMFEDAYKNAIDFEENGLRLKVININNLIQNKLASRRNKDLDDAAALQKILNKRK